jgi:uncharacterized protein YwqG
MPRIHGRPPHCSGSTVILSESVFTSESLAGRSRVPGPHRAPLRWRSEGGPSGRVGECPVVDDLRIQTLRHELTRYGLQHHQDVILGAAREAIRLRPAGGEGTSRDASRLGGGAALPKGMSWPTWKGRPQALLAQIVLAEVASLDGENVLPPSGRLLFFYDSGQETWGFDPADRGSWTVLFVEDGQPMEPFVDPGLFRPVPLTASAEIDLPPCESLWFASSGIAPDEVDAYLELRTSLSGDYLIHKLLGYPDPIQNEMQTECQLVSHGIYCGNADGYRDPRAETLRPGANDWRLLLQVDSEEDRAGMMWGDVGRVYFWIRDEDLRARNFDRTWCILQCC